MPLSHCSLQPRGAQQRRTQRRWRLNERRGGEKGSIAFTQFYMRKSRKEGSEEVLEEVSCEKKLGGDGGGEIMEL